MCLLFTYSIKTVCGSLDKDDLLPSRLVDDDTCDVHGPHGAGCALHALQRKNADSNQLQKRLLWEEDKQWNQQLWEDGKVSTQHDLVATHKELTIGETASLNKGEMSTHSNVVNTVTKLTIGESAPLNDEGYKAVLKLRNNREMAFFIRRTVKKLGGVIVKERMFKEFVPFYSGIKLGRTYHLLLKEIREKARVPHWWVKLPPPVDGTVLRQMIRPDPWVCDLLPGGDYRHHTCNIQATDASLHPQLIDCAPDGCGVEHVNAYRTRWNIGALPCCPFGEACAAPQCSPTAGPAPSQCTMRTPEEYVQYMKEPKSWPAYHGNGGAYELDVLKYLDVLGCRDNSTGKCQSTTFDLVMDLGANIGYFTEKLTLRNFGKNYIMVEANMETVQASRTRWNNEAFKTRWFAQQVPKPAVIPNFELHATPLSSVVGKKVNMCETEYSMHSDQRGCTQETTTLDNLVYNQLSQEFLGHFKNAESAYIKVDTEGMDQMVFEGMHSVLQETRGTYEDGKPRYLVNFMQLEFCPRLMGIARKREKLESYDLKTMAQTLESAGFEAFLMGPRFLPLNFGHWHSEYLLSSSDAENNPGVLTNYPEFESPICKVCGELAETTFTSDIFAMRHSHPRAAEIKRALGVCVESQDFNISDPQYYFP